MNVIIEYGTSQSELSDNGLWDIALYGLSHKEERCDQAIQFVKSKVLKSVCLVFDADKNIISIDESQVIADNILESLKQLGITSDSKIVLEMTSLGVVELLLILQALHDLCCASVDVVYVQPAEYPRQNTIEFTERHFFNLSDAYMGFRGIPGHSLAIEHSDKLVVLCGFDAERLGRVFEDSDFQGKNCQLILGVPPYVIGYDMHAYTNHINLIDKYQISREFYYCGAANPLAVYEKIDCIYNGLEENQKMFIFPCGTKPMALGACLFKVEKNQPENVGFLYDHPIKTSGKSKSSSMWYKYHIIL